MRPGTSYGLLYNPRQRIKKFFHKSFSLGFMITREMVEDDLYAQTTKVLYMKEIKHYKLDAADRYMMRQLRMDEFSYLAYVWDALYDNRHLTVPEENERMLNAQQSSTPAEAHVGYARPVGASVNQAAPFPQSTGVAPKHSSPIMQMAQDANSIHMEMRAVRERLNKLRDTMYSTDPRDPMHLSLSGEIAMAYEQYCNAAERLFSLTA